MADQNESGNMPDLYDRLLGGMHGLPDCVQTKPATLRYVEPVVGRTVTHIVQTIRQRDLGDHIFLEIVTGAGILEIVTGAGTVRVVIPPNVADTIARQRDALSTMSRRKAARAVAQDRKDRGIAPAFTKNPPKRRKGATRGKA
jgi:hypothetical protein